MDNSLKTIEIGKSFGKSLLYTLPMFLITFMFITGGKPNFSDPASGLAMLTVFLLVNVLYFFMHFTGKTDRYRAVLFIIFAMSLSYTCLLYTSDAADE